MVCALCQRSCRAGLCAACQSQVLGGAAARCPRCALRIQHEARECGACLSQPPAYDLTVTAVDYAAPQDMLVQQLKFGGALPLAGVCADLLTSPLMALVQPPSTQQSGGQGRALLPGGAGLPELLCPVPLGAARLAERGYNQSLEIARVLAKRLALPLAPRLLVRCRDTAPQAGLQAALRQANLRGAFALSPGGADQVKNRHIGVVDDVMTTGATLEEIARVLKRHGAARVTNIVFARTAAPG